MATAAQHRVSAAVWNKRAEEAHERADAAIEGTRQEKDERAYANVAEDQADAHNRRANDIEKEVGL